jgi:chromosome segregation ATPase
MSQSQTRQQVAEYLSKHGPLEDDKGRATAKLMEALGYEGSIANFAQLISNMDRSGQLTREVKGKRTYRIAAATDELASSIDDRREQAESAEMAEMDYDKVASALLVQVVQNLTKGPRSGGENDGSWARRRIERLERRIDELERDLSHSKAESNTLAAERDELRLQLEHSEGNLALLTERTATRKPREGQLSKLLDADERALLHQLRGVGSGNAQGRGSYAKSNSR